MPDMEDYHFEGSLNDDPKTKLHKLMNKLSPRKMGGLIATLVVAIMLPVTLIAMQQTQNVKQHASETWRKVAELDGNIGKNPYDNNNFYPATLVEFSSSLHVFVIGEGGPSSGKPQGDWYNLYVSSTDQPSVAWGGYRLLGGNASSMPQTKQEGDTLRVMVRGLTIDNGGNMTPQYSTFYSKRRQLLSDFPEGGNGWEIADNSGWSFSNSVTYSRDRKTYRARTDSGRVIIEVLDVTHSPTATTVPNAPTATPVVSNPSCNVAGCGRTASRCSQNYGCTRAYYNPATANSCGDPVSGSVTYKKDASCGIITQDQKRQRGFDVNNDAINTPCYSDALTDLQRTYGTTTPICTGNVVLPTVAPTTVATPTPAQSCNVAGCGRTASRCSLNYGCTRAYYNPATSNSCGAPVDGTVTYKVDASCGIITQDQKRQRGFDVNSDARNTPCYSTATADLQRTWGASTPICTGSSPATPVPTRAATPVPTSGNRPTPVPGA